PHGRCRQKGQSESAKLRLDIDAVVLINEALTGNRCSEERKQRVGGCLSSYSYYDTVREQITSIVVSLLKGHFFQDGNKRTALAIYLDLCQNNGIKFLSDQDRLGDVLIDIAANQRGITENTRLLFPD
ncbi:type II toxin-antitoxin system death-on-curing family toxin, partial [Parasutterella excrementihominis]|uniref:type II toxin-antitoxin system death-on-curing family toxin n=1 Tax=Parasutterella excrementihominis TaxID=487175 RepID=UPI003FF09055